MAGDALLPEVAAVQLSGVVVSNATHVMGAEAPSLAGYQGGGYLTTEHDLGAESFDLGAERRELSNLQNRVGGVLADAEDVESRGAHKVVVQGIGRAGKCKEG